MLKITGRILIVIIALYLLAIPALFTAGSGRTVCSGISINITDSSELYLVSKREIRSLLFLADQKIIGESFDMIPGGKIEERISRLKELKTAELYCTADGILHVYADQRNPIMRLIAGGGDFFVDEDGVVFRKKKLYTPRLHIVEGNIRITNPMLNGVSVLDTAVKNSILKDLHEFVAYIRTDNFWSAQIDQVYVDNEDDIVLVPRLGNHRVLLGTIDNYKDKLRNLEAFYRDVLPLAGYNKYNLINLEFRDQIVCRKR